MQVEKISLFGEKSVLTFPRRTKKKETKGREQGQWILMWKGSRWRGHHPLPSFPLLSEVIFSTGSPSNQHQVTKWENSLLSFRNLQTPLVCAGCCGCISLGWSFCSSLPPTLRLSWKALLWNGKHVESAFGFLFPPWACKPYRGGHGVSIGWSYQRSPTDRWQLCLRRGDRLWLDPQLSG